MIMWSIKKIYELLKKNYLEEFITFRQVFFKLCRASIARNLGAQVKIYT